MMIREIGEKMTKRIIEYENVHNLSLKEVFRLFFEDYKELCLDEDKVLIQITHYLSKYGYDITSTHPFKLKKYK